MRRRRRAFVNASSGGYLRPLPVAVPLPPSPPLSPSPNEKLISIIPEGSCARRQGGLGGGRRRRVGGQTKVKFMYHYEVGANLRNTRIERLTRLMHLILQGSAPRR